MTDSNDDILRYKIFSDASFDPRFKQGVGAFVVLTENSFSMARAKIKTMKFAATTCARVEIATAIRALKEAESHFQSHQNISMLPVEWTLYTDSQTIVQLGARRAKLEANEYKSRRTNNLLSNGDLYQDFFSIIDRLSVRLMLNIVWVKGHSPKENRTLEQAIFAKVDQAARATLRKLQEGLG